MAALSIVAIWRQTPRLAADPSWGILAAEQTRVGRSASIVELVVADPDDLSRDTVHRLSWWAPGYQAVPYVVRRWSETWGAAVKWTVLTGWAIGAAGWCVYFAGILGDRGWFGWFVAAFLLFRYSHQGASVYEGGETLLWACFPLTYLLNLHALFRARSATAAGAGAAIAGLVLVKYSAALLVVALAAVWWIEVSAGRVARRSAAGWSAAVLAVFAGCWLVGLPGGATPAATSGQSNLAAPLWSAAVWPLAMTDLDGLARWLLLHPSCPLWHDEQQLAWLGLMPLVAFLVAWWQLGRPWYRQLVANDRWRSLAGRSALMVLVVTATTLALLMLRGGRITAEARHLRMAAMVVLPFATALLVDAARAGGGVGRFVAVAGLVLLLVVPAGYGALVLTEKTFFRAARLAGTIGPDGLRMAHLEPGDDANALFAELDGYLTPGSLLYVAAPDLGLARAGHRLLVEQADTLSDEQWNARPFLGRPAGAVVLLVPAHFDVTGKTRRFQARFHQVTNWHPMPLQSVNGLVLWRGT